MKKKPLIKNSINENLQELPKREREELDKEKALKRHTEESEMPFINWKNKICSISISCKSYVDRHLNWF